MTTSEIKGAMYIGSVVITKSLTKLKAEESEIVIQLAINKVCHFKILISKSNFKVFQRLGKIFLQKISSLGAYLTILAFDKNWANIIVSIWIKTSSNSERNDFDHWTSTNGNHK